MPNVCIVNGDDLWVATELKKPNDLMTVVPLESLYCKYGLVLPTEYNSLTLIDILDGKSSHHFSKEAVIIGAILTFEGVIYEFYQGNFDETIADSGIRRRRVHTGPGCRYIKANASRTEEQVAMMMHLIDRRHIECIEDGLRILERCSPGHGGKMEKLSVQNVMIQLQEKGFTAEIPSHIHFNDLATLRK